ncbi:hypothetical protein LOD99_10748 [Oopsacas minuta]|uniref:Uncharacterized protein n=1 Tax=Oopsacas minuta TaxID=111878 RepID=A0AAV7KFM9_9METZ|nr:hypothetical protein LOD99_10748 [Oopsacas minuta]
MPECTPKCEVDMWIVREIERVWDYPSSKVTECWRKALELREKYNLGYPGEPAIDLCEGVQQGRALTDIYNISQKNYLIQCVLISERVFGPLYYTSCDLKIRLTNHFYSEGSVYYWRCCELLYQLLQAVVETSWMSTQASVNEFVVLLHQVNTLLPAFNTDVMTMEREKALLKAEGGRSYKGGQFGAENLPEKKKRGRGQGRTGLTGRGRGCVKRRVRERSVCPASMPTSWFNIKQAVLILVDHVAGDHSGCPTGEKSWCRWRNLSSPSVLTTMTTQIP